MSQEFPSSQRKAVPRYHSTLRVHVGTVGTHGQVPSARLLQGAVRGLVQAALPGTWPVAQLGTCFPETAWPLAGVPVCSTLLRLEAWVQCPQDMGHRMPKETAELGVCPSHGACHWTALVSSTGRAGQMG